MTKRILIWGFWYVVGYGLILNSENVGFFEPWFTEVMLCILYMWWGRFLAGKYPRFRKLVYVVTAVLVLATFSLIFVEDSDLFINRTQLFNGLTSIA